MTVVASGAQTMALGGSFYSLLKGLVLKEKLQHDLNLFVSYQGVSERHVSSRYIGQTILKVEINVFLMNINFSCKKII